MAKNIEIVFTRSKKTLPIFSWAIMLYTGKKYSHVARKLQTRISEQPSYFQASEGKVNYEHEKWFSKENEIVKSYNITVPDSVYANMAKKSWELAGQNYGYMQNIGIVLCDMLKLIGIRAKNPWKKGINCSELIYTTILLPLFPDLKYRPDLIKPHEIEDIIINKFNK